MSVPVVTGILSPRPTMKRQQIGETARESSLTVSTRFTSSRNRMANARDSCTAAEVAIVVERVTRLNPSPVRHWRTLEKPGYPADYSPTSSRAVRRRPRLIHHQSR